MTKFQIPVTADCCRATPPGKRVVPLVEQSLANHETRFAEQPGLNQHIGAGNDQRDLVHENGRGQGVAKLQRRTSHAEHRTDLPEDWREMSLGALWDYLNRPNRTPQTTIEAVLDSVRERGLEALKEPANIARLSGCDEMARAEINKRIARLLGAEGAGA